jgi:hypothetical protein
MVTSVLAVAGLSVSCFSCFSLRELNTVFNFYKFLECERMLSMDDKAVLWCSDLCLINTLDGLLHAFVLLLLLFA